MLSIGFCRNPDYYDYHLKGKNPGRWYGSGAAPLGLIGIVLRAAFRAIFQGRKEDGTPLVQLQDGRTHQPAWDLTFSAPKSFSVLWSTANRRLRRALERVHVRAVKKALNYLQNVAAYTRRGKAGCRIERAKLVFALFTEYASREGDQQLHTHAVTMNVAVRDDGSTGTVVSKCLYEHKLAAGAVYQAALAEGARRLGFVTKAAKTGFDIDGIPKELCEEQSKRRKAIETLLGDKDEHSTKAAQVACLATRPAKNELPFSEQLDHWRTTSARFGLTEKSIDRLRRPASKLANGTRQKAETVAQITDDRLAQDAVQTLSQTQNLFTAREVYRQALNASLELGRDPEKIRAAVERTLSDDLVTVGRRNGYLEYTTPEILVLEAELLARVERLATNASRIDPKDLEPILDRRLPLDPSLPPLDLARNGEQRLAVQHLTTNPGAIQVLSGKAGTGKSFTMGIVSEVEERAGLVVRGYAVAGAAARRLEEDTGIKSDTLALLLEKLKHARLVENIVTGAKSYIAKPTKKFPDGEVLLSPKHSLYLDEAALCPTVQLAELIKHVDITSARLKLLGDRTQLQPVEAGCPMRAIEARVGRAELKVITRQRLEADDPVPAWQRQAVEHFSKGESVDGLLLLAERGKVSVLENQDAAKIALVRDWCVSSVEKPKDHLVLAADNASVADLNELCQLARRQRELITEEFIHLNGEKIHQYDRVICTKRSRTLGLENGDFANVVSINRRKKTVTLELDRGPTVVVPTAEYPHLKLGYSITVFRSQGASVEKASVLCSGRMMDLHNGYVMSSRHKGECRLYVSRFEAGNLLQDLAIQMATSREKGLATELLHETKQSSVSLSKDYYEQPIDNARPDIGLEKLARLEQYFLDEEPTLSHTPKKTIAEIEAQLAELRRYATNSAPPPLKVEEHLKIEEPQLTHRLTTSPGRS